MRKDEHEAFYAGFEAGMKSGGTSIARRNRNRAVKNAQEYARTDFNPTNNIVNRDCGFVLSTGDEKDGIDFYKDHASGRWYFVIDDGGYAEYYECDDSFVERAIFENLGASAVDGTGLDRSKWSRRRKKARRESARVKRAMKKNARAVDFIVIPRVPDFNEFAHYEGNIPEVGALDMTSVSELYLFLDDYYEFALLVCYDTRAEAWQWSVWGTSPDYMGEGLWDTRSFGCDSPEEAYSQMKRAIERCDTAYTVA